MIDDHHTPSPKTMSRRFAVRGLGLAGAAGVAATLASGRPAHAEETGSVRTATLAELRAATTADTGAIYYVTDPGQEGPFRYDATDSTSTDNTGTVIVSGAGHRFLRVVEGPLRLSWFGAKADYNPRNGKGTPADDALDLALAALERYASLAPTGRGSSRGLPTIVFDAGNYVFRRGGHALQWATGVTGLHFEGQGMHQTSVHLDIDEAQHGSENHFLVNDGQEVDALGVVNTFTIDGITFFGASGTDRFMRYADKPRAGVAKKMYFSRCSWVDLHVGFDIRGTANSDHIRFTECVIQDHSADAVFFHSDNPQAQNHDFVNCNFETRGRTFKFLAGGSLHVRGCQITVFEAGVFLEINDPTGDRIGIGNGTYNLTDLNPEVKHEGKLLHLNAPEANVTFVNPRFVTGLAQVAKNWEDGKAFEPGAYVRMGAAPHLTSYSKQRAFKCLTAHTATAATRPLLGENWTDVWEPLYDMRIDAGAVNIRGGSTVMCTLMTYGDDAYLNGKQRGHLRFSDGCRLVNPVADMVDFAPIGEVGTTASLPRVIASGCRPYTGAYPSAYGVTPYDPVDVSLNAHYGYEGGIAPANRYIFTAGPESGHGLPSKDDGELTFRLPRGAHVTGVRLVSNTATSDNSYRVTNHDGSEVFLPGPDGTPKVDRWYEVDSEAARTFKVTSTADAPAAGFLAVEYF